MNITKTQLTNILKDLQAGGKAFTVCFEKADKSMRKMTCRTGVKKYVKGAPNGASKASNEDIVKVWEMGRDSKGHFISNGAKGYRSFRVDRVKSLKVGGKMYMITDINH